MTDIVWHPNLPGEELYVRVAYPEKFVCWGFDLDKLARAYGYHYKVGAYKALLKGLGELAMSEDQRLRECHLTIWHDEIFPNFWLGVPECKDAAFKILNRHLRRVKGYPL